MFSWESPPSCSISPAFNFSITVAVRVSLLLKLLALITGPSFKVSLIGVPLTNKIALKLNLLISSPTPVKE